MCPSNGCQRADPCGFAYAWRPPQKHGHVCCNRSVQRIQNHIQTIPVCVWLVKRYVDDARDAHDARDADDAHDARDAHDAHDACDARDASDASDADEKDAAAARQAAVTLKSVSP